MTKYQGPSKEHLEAAAIIAPVVRSMKPETRRKRVKVVDAAGVVKGEVPYEEAMAGLLKAHEIEIQVQDGTRPKEFQCKACKRWGKVPAKGNVPTYCIEPCICSTHGCKRRAASRTAVLSAHQRGSTPMCPHCAEQRRVAAVREHQAMMTAEQRRERVQRLHAALTAEQRSEMCRKNGAAAIAALTPEQRSERGRRVAVVAHTTLSPKQRKEKALKGWKTRRAKAKAAKP